jgi:hypothetical protein
MSITKRFETKNGHWYKMDGVKVDGVTTVLSNGIPKPALVPWAAREVATFAARNLTLLADLEEDARIDLLKGAHYRDRDKAAKRGTEVHRLAEQIIGGAPIDVPDELVGHVDSYLKFLEDWDVAEVLVEFVVGHRAHKWMGTGDLIADLADGNRWLLDLKTTRSGIYGETALQLAAYRHAEFYIDSDGELQPMLPVDKVGAIWCRADGYDLIPVDADAATYATFRYAQQVAKFTTHYSKEWVHDSLQPPPKDNAA